MIKLGSHISFKKPDYLISAIEESLDNGANAMMIYLGPPQTTMRVDPSQYNYDKYLKKYSSIIPSENIVVHAPYIVNPSSPSKYKFAVDFLASEINRMNTIGAKYLVLHPGSSTEFTKEEALNTLVKSLRRIIELTSDVVICLETMAGKGSQVCSSFSEIDKVIKEVNSERVAICLDTCHVWDAGYNIKNYEEFKSHLIKHDYLKHIKVIHLNDSLNELGSKKDRHANLNNGFIGLNTLKKFVFDKDFENIPIILETPYVNNQPIYKQEIEMLLDGVKLINGTQEQEKLF
ncbi:deoxyribonuclease IV [Mycoplasma phocoeninasale]|uniref:Probable endonuclease 4 n=1 Tax=Mycoplasma phocoeninasale TaxID=2726117 RepID=A0A858U2E6_9MOLU|nr:deoxyribonuclease IV [Mycoplasma phocoeninasale]MBN0970792.1 deoxyribonuclease IV [Mycoplasma phocoeninasale]QJG66650.1 deoxyribonuclease IV [Mycoplasma phocoeninasale]